MKKLPPCLNPDCRKRKVRGWWSSMNLLNPHPALVPIHSVDDVRYHFATDDKKREDLRP